MEEDRNPVEDMHVAGAGHQATLSKSQKRKAKKQKQGKDQSQASE